MPVRIALIHATPLSINPISEAFDAHWPQAGTMNILDDSLSADRAASDVPIENDDAMTERFVTLARYAASCGADGILFTCSAFGPCIEAARDALSMPVLKPNEAMFQAARAHGGKIGLVASFQPSIPPMAEEFSRMTQGEGVALETRVADGAMTALADGDAERHDAMLTEQASTLSDCNAIMLAQFSTARAAPRLAEATGKPILTSPQTAVCALREAVG